MDVVDAYLSRGGLDEVRTGGVDVDTGDFAGSAGDELNAHRTGAGEKIHHRALLVVDIVVEDVEKALTSHVGGGPHRQVGWRVETTATKTSGNDTHQERIKA